MNRADAKLNVKDQAAVSESSELSRIKAIHEAIRHEAYAIRKFQEELLGRLDGLAKADEINRDRLADVFTFLRKINDKIPDPLFITPTPDPLPDELTWPAPKRVKPRVAARKRVKAKKRGGAK